MSKIDNTTPGQAERLLLHDELDAVTGCGPSKQVDLREIVTRVENNMAVKDQI